MDISFNDDNISLKIGDINYIKLDDSCNIEEFSPFILQTIRIKGESYKIRKSQAEINKRKTEAYVNNTLKLYSDKKIKGTAKSDDEVL